MPAVPTTLPEAFIASAVASVLGTGLPEYSVGTTPKSVIVYFCCALAGLAMDRKQIASSNRKQGWRNQVFAVVAGAPLPVPIAGLHASSNETSLATPAPWRSELGTNP